MAIRPDISVVIGVFNCASSLSRTLDSILAQNEVDLELVAINDGSTDDSGSILSAYATRDPRVTVLNQQNEGLTSALIKGCDLAKGEFIARHDAGGDISLPGRLAHQREFLRTHDQAVMTACGTQFVDTQDTKLYEVSQSGIELHNRISATSLDRIGGPSHHGAVMFHRSVYERVGGYRRVFKVAQDLDLWSRMVEEGYCLATPEIFYVARLDRTSISHLHRGQQVAATRTIFRCAEARKGGGDEGPILEKFEPAEEIRSGLMADRIHDARYYYFLGSVLRSKRPQRASSYFIQALRAWPFHMRAWLGLFRAFWNTRIYGRTARH